jgi:hypothetical protein
MSSLLMGGRRVPTRYVFFDKVESGLSKGTDVFRPDVVQDGGHCSVPVS